MNISWYGHSCFKIQSKEVILITDPFSKEIGIKPPFGAADIVTVSHHHANHDNSAVIKNDPFVVDGPGEYEIKKAVIRGIESFHNDNKEEKNTIYTIETEEIKICHLGDLGQKSLDSDQLSRIGDIDILFIPVGGVNTINSKDAENIIGQIEPRMVIPMHYKLKGVKGCLEKLDDISSFCQSHSLDPKQTVSKIALKKKDLPEEDTQYVLMDLGK